MNLRKEKVAVRLDCSDGAWVVGNPFLEVFDDVLVSSDHRTHLFLAVGLWESMSHIIVEFHVHIHAWNTFNIY